MQNTQAAGDRIRKIILFICHTKRTVSKHTDSPARENSTWMNKSKHILTVMRLKNGEKNMKWNCRNFIKRKKNEESKRKEQAVFRRSPSGRSTDIYLLWDNVRKHPIGWLIEETPDKERLIPQKEMPVFFMDKNNTYTSSSGRKFKIIKNPRGHWIVQSGDRKERVSIEWQL